MRPSPPFRVVLDTNVLVAALLNPGRTPDQALTLLLLRGDVVLHDARLVAEYVDVLGRAKFKRIEASKRDALLASLLAAGETVVVGESYDGPMVDADDRPFVEVALAGRADAIVTGNARHFPSGAGVDVLTPDEFLRRTPS